MKNSAKRFVAVGALVAASLVAPMTHAADYLVIHWSVQEDPANWLSVETIGMSPGLAFVRFKRGTSLIPQANLPSGVTSCLNGLFYIDITQPHGILNYQQLLLAKNTGKRMSRADFSQDAANGICYLYLTAQME